MTRGNAARRRPIKGLACHALMLSTLLLAGGCAFGRATLGDDIRQEGVVAIKNGVSTRTDVVARTGAPDRIVQANGRESLPYYRYDLKSSSLLLILVNFSRFNIKSDDLYVLLNREGVVEDVLFGRRTDKPTFRAWLFGE
ncbi:MAG: hypothetical protein H8K10_06795 [Nitrospira sp.]|nr:hypothetical protein [Nitrospira sp.]